MGAVQRAAAPDQPEPGAVLPARDHLRRGRPGHVRPAQPAGPDAIHVGGGQGLGHSGGEAAHILAIAETPPHAHTALGTSTDGDAPVGAGNYLGGADNLYAPLAHTTPLPPSTIANAGGQAHNNMQPYLVLNFCIALQGSYPTRP